MTFEPISSVSPKISIQELSMQWMDLEATEKYINQNYKQPETTKLPTKLGKVIQTVIDIYNERQKHSDSHFEGGKAVFEHSVYKLRVYGKGYSFKTHLAEKVETIGLPNQKNNQGSDFLLFYCRKKPTPEIVVLSSNQAWHAVRGCINYYYPIKIAERILNPEKIKEISRRSLMGHSVHETIKYPTSGEFYKTSSLYYFVEHFICEVKPHASLLNLSPFLEETSKARIPVPPNVKITSGGLLRIKKKIDLEQYPAIFSLFNQYIHDQETYDNHGKIEARDPLFEFLHYVQPAQLDETILDEELVNSLYDSYHTKKSFCASFLHKYLDDFLNASSYQMQVKKGGHFQTLPPTTPTLLEILNLIQLHHNPLDAKNLLGILNEAKLKYVKSTTREETCESTFNRMPRRGSES